MYAFIILLLNTHTNQSRPRSEFEQLTRPLRDSAGEGSVDDAAPSIFRDNGEVDVNQLSNEYVIDFARLKILRRIGDRSATVELLAAFLDGQPVWYIRFL